MRTSSYWQKKELLFLVLYAVVFYAIVIRRSLQLARDHIGELYGLRHGWIADRLNDVSDTQWRNFRGNLPILTAVFGIFTFVANVLRISCCLKAKGMSIVWLVVSLAYLSYLHGACIIFIITIAVANFLLVKIFGRTKYFSFLLWIFNLSFLMCNRIYEGYRFSSFGEHWAFLDKFRGTFRWHICFNFVVLRMISFGYDYHWAGQYNRFDQKKIASGIVSSTLCWSSTISGHIFAWGYNGFPYAWFMKEHDLCIFHLPVDDNLLLKFMDRIILILLGKYLIFGPFFLFLSGKSCYSILQEKSVASDKFSLPIYLCYLIYAPLYIAGPIISFNAFTSQLDSSQKIYSSREVALYGFRWVFSLLILELMSHLFYYNAFAISGVWKQLSPMDVFIIGYGVLNFMWLKFLLIWRYFRFWSLINGIEAPENMPRCINNCHNLESFWKNWHASFNKWLVRYVYIPLGGSQKKLLNIWVIFTFVAVWHDLEWKLLSWAWLTCIFFIPEMLVKSASNAFPVEGSLGKFVFCELRAVAGAVTITCLMVANLVGFVIGPSGIDLFGSRFLSKEGLPTLFGLLISFYVGTKLMFHISDAKQRKDRRNI